jgi:hypothetical protein
LLDISFHEGLSGGTAACVVYHVQIGNIVYSGRVQREERWRSGDAGHGLIVGDPVQAAIDGDKLVLLRPDRKEIEAKIIKRERASTE